MQADELSAVSNSITVYNYSLRADTPLHIASRCGRTRTAQSLIKEGADLNAKDHAGLTPLHVAISNNHKDIAELLITSGADINFCNHNNCSPLHFAACYGYTEVAQLLIKKGADMNVSDSFYDTPLHDAIANEHKDIVELLITSGADINLRNAKNLCTPFSYLNLSRCSAEVVRFFIENGAYVEPIEYHSMRENSTLKGSILQDIKICSQSFINKFNCLDLPELFKLPMEFIERLPPIDKFEIALNRGVKRDVEQAVAQEIRTKGHCNLLKVRPLVLRLFCVASLIKYFDGIKAMR